MKKFISISFLFIFLLAQYGRVLSYAYCKWESRSLAQCDCEKVFALDDHQKDHQLSKINASIKLEDPVILYSTSFPVKPVALQNATYPRSMQNVFAGFLRASFHPPSLI